MPLIRASRSAQYPLHAEFTFNVTDTMANTSGATVALGAAAGSMFDAIKLPPNAVVIGGDVTVDVVSNDSGTATIAVGDSGSATRYLAATSIKAAARTPLVPTGYRGTGEDIRLTLANAGGGATAGTVSVRVSYIVTGRAQEVQAG
jgi:hypothetical protein